MNKTVSVLGMGYIGLPLALLLANAGYKVNGFDIDKKRIDLLIKKRLPFEEKGLEDLFKKVNKSNNFKPSTKLVESDYYIVAVPTPHKNHEADLIYVFRALSFIKKVFKDGQTIIIESTVGPRDPVKKIIPYIKKWGQLYHFAVCPERAIPGNTLSEMVGNARIIGGLTKNDSLLAKLLYESIVCGEIFLTSTTVAATCKVMENSFRDVNIALANEYAKIAEELRFNVWEAISLANKHPRVSILSPGPGVGGHCIPIDPWFLAASSKNADLITTSRNINDGMPAFVSKSVEKFIKKEKITNPKVGILGYAYKKNVDDSRETPSKEVIRLLKRKYKVLVSDPFVSISSEKMLDLDKLLTSADVVVLLTDHEVFKSIHFSDYPNILMVYDSRNLFNSKNFINSHAKHVILGVGSEK